MLESRTLGEHELILFQVLIHGLGERVQADLYLVLLASTIVNNGQASRSSSWCRSFEAGGSLRVHLLYAYNKRVICHVYSRNMRPTPQMPAAPNHLLSSSESP